MVQETGLEGLLGGVDELGGIDANTTFSADKFDIDRPVPGQSLMEEPGAAPWEQPPEVTDPKEVLDGMFNAAMEPDNARQLLRLMDAGVPIETIIEPILMHGVQEGKWSIDTALFVAPGFMHILNNMAVRAGLAPTFAEKKKEDPASDLADIKAVFSKNKDEPAKEAPSMEDVLGEAPNAGPNLLDSVKRGE